MTPNAAAHKVFAFETEFAPDGAVLSGPERAYYSRDEAQQLAASARADGEAKARQSAEARGFATVERIVGHLSPVAAQLAQVADTLRREAAELALIAARKIAGDALDANGARIAADAVAEAIRLLKNNPSVTVSAAPDALPEIDRKLDQLRRQRGNLAVTFVPDPAARPGDWRIDWAEGVAQFRREDVEAVIENVVRSRLEDPVEPQLGLFSAA